MVELEERVAVVRWRPDFGVVVLVGVGTCPWPPASRQRLASALLWAAFDGRGPFRALQRAVLRGDNVEVVVAEALAVVRGDHLLGVLRAAADGHVVDAEQSGQVVR